MPERERGLNDKFKADLKKGGLLEEVTNLVKRDLTLDFQIRRDQVHIYYRGGKIWDIKWNNSYKAYFDKGYCRKKIESTNKIKSLPLTLSSKPEVNLWIETIPFLKQTMDEYFAKHEDAEREFQQLVVRENNYSCVSNKTDYFIVDIEYGYKRDMRFDMVALLWPSKPQLRKLSGGFKPKLALIEMKFSEGALNTKKKKNGKETPGIQKHIRDVDKFLSKIKNIEKINKEAVDIFCIKRQLGLIHFGPKGNNKKIKDLSNEQPELILLLAAHDPDSRTLEDVLAALKPMKHADLKIATANFMGYSLYRQAMYDLTTFRKMFSNRILEKK